jgi:uncharacterized lipoprotein YmbA
MRIPRIAWASLALLASGCAAPPLTLYTLGAPAVAVGSEHSAADAPVLEVRRVSLPDYLDTPDIVTRDGQTIMRSRKGRWASRLSLGVTDLITAQLAAARPDLLVIDQPEQGTPRYRLFVNISRLDISADGTAALTASWSIEPNDAARPDIRGRASFAQQGPVTTDADVVALTNSLVDRLAARIALDLARAAR